MMLVMFPCPPLPIVGAMIENEPTQMSSHDSLAFCADVTARRADRAGNEQRAHMQFTLTSQYMDAMLKCINSEKTNTSAVVNMYWIMCDFTRRYTQLYFPEAQMDIRFAGMDSVSTNVKRRACEWLAARQYVDGEMEGARAGDHIAKDMEQIYWECALLISRTWFAMGEGGPPEPTMRPDLVGSDSFL
jgi:hypothetical protein